MEPSKDTDNDATSSGNTESTGSIPKSKDSTKKNPKDLEICRPTSSEADTMIAPNKPKTSKESTGTSKSLGAIPKRQSTVEKQQNEKAEEAGTLTKTTTIKEDNKTNIDQSEEAKSRKKKKKKKNKNAKGKQKCSSASDVESKNTEEKVTSVHDTEATWTVLDPGTGLKLVLAKVRVQLGAIKPKEKEEDVKTPSARKQNTNKALGERKRSPVEDRRQQDVEKYYPTMPRGALNATAPLVYIPTRITERSDQSSIKPFQHREIETGSPIAFGEISHEEFSEIVAKATTNEEFLFPDQTAATHTEASSKPHPENANQVTVKLKPSGQNVLDQSFDSPKHDEGHTIPTSLKPDTQNTEQHKEIIKLIEERIDELMKMSLVDDDSLSIPDILGEYSLDDSANEATMGVGSEQGKIQETLRVTSKPRFDPATENIETLILSRLKELETDLGVKLLREEAAWREKITSRREEGIKRYHELKRALRAELKFKSDRIVWQPTPWNTQWKRQNKRRIRPSSITKKKQDVDSTLPERSAVSSSVKANKLPSQRNASVPRRTLEDYQRAMKKTGPPNLQIKRHEIPDLIPITSPRKLRQTKSDKLLSSAEKRPELKAASSTSKGPYSPTRSNFTILTTEENSSQHKLARTVSTTSDLTDLETISPIISPSNYSSNTSASFSSMETVLKVLESRARRMEKFELARAKRIERTNKSTANKSASLPYSRYALAAERNILIRPMKMQALLKSRDDSKIASYIASKVRNALRKVRNQTKRCYPIRHVPVLKASLSLLGQYLLHKKATNQLKVNIIKGKDKFDSITRKEFENIEISKLRATEEYNTTAAILSYQACRSKSSTSKKHSKPNKKTPKSLRQIRPKSSTQRRKWKRTSNSSIPSTSQHAPNKDTTLSLKHGETQPHHEDLAYSLYLQACKETGSPPRIFKSTNTSVETSRSSENVQEDYNVSVSNVSARIQLLEIESSETMHLDTSQNIPEESSSAQDLEENKTPKSVTKAESIRSTSDDIAIISGFLSLNLTEWKMTTNSTNTKK